MEERTINSSDKQEILEAIGSLAVKVGSMASSQGSLAAKVDSLATAQEETFREVMETMNAFATDTEGRFERLEKDVQGLKTDVGMIKATMVTRDYIDVSISKSYGDAVAMVRKEDDKVDSFVGLLSNKQLITKPEAKKIVFMGPFPKTG